MGVRRNRTWSLIPSRRRLGPPPALGSKAPSAEGLAACAGDPRPTKGRREAATLAVQRGLLQAEEKYLVDPGATLGTWFARVQETIAVASQVTIARIEEWRLPTEDDVADEQVGLYADICAEAIRAAARVWGEQPSPRAREEILHLVSGRQPAAAPRCWTTFLESLARCSAALEPLANGLREMDLPMDEPTDCGRVAESLLEAAGHAFGAVYVLC